MSDHPAARCPSLLIADDDPTVREFLDAALRDTFRIVGVAATGLEAIALAERYRPELALIDVEMPGGDARTAVPRIAERSPGTRMVILSGDESDQIVRELLIAGATTYVRKGVGGPQIADALARTLDA